MRHQIGATARAPRWGSGFKRGASTGEANARKVILHRTPDDRRHRREDQRHLAQQDGGRGIGQRMRRTDHEHDVILVEMLEGEIRHLACQRHAADHGVNRPLPQKADQVMMRARFDGEGQLWCARPERQPRGA